jgi:hypothetical protein
VSTLQAIYLEQVLREGFSHPAVDGDHAMDCTPS